MAVVLPAITVFDALWWPVVLGHFLLALIAIISLSRASSNRSFLSLGLWSVLIILVPVLGPAAWLLAARRNADEARTSE